MDLVNIYRKRFLKKLRKYPSKNNKICYYISVKDKKMILEFFENIKKLIILFGDLENEPVFQDPSVSIDDHTTQLNHQEESRQFENIKTNKIRLILNRTIYYLFCNSLVENRCKLQINDECNFIFENNVELDIPCTCHTCRRLKTGDSSMSSTEGQVEQEVDGSKINLINQNLSDYKKYLLPKSFHVSLFNKNDLKITETKIKEDDVNFYYGYIFEFYYKENYLFDSLNFYSLNIKINEEHVLMYKQMYNIYSILYKKNFIYEKYISINQTLEDSYMLNFTFYDYKSFDKIYPHRNNINIYILSKYLDSLFDYMNIQKSSNLHCFVKHKESDPDRSKSPLTRTSPGFSTDEQVRKGSRTEEEYFLINNEFFARIISFNDRFKKEKKDNFQDSNLKLSDIEGFCMDEYINKIEKIKLLFSLTSFGKKIGELFVKKIDVE